jgi:CRP-like cAMP-binding protein
VASLRARRSKAEHTWTQRIAGDLSVAIHAEGHSDPIRGLVRDLTVDGGCLATRTPLPHVGSLRISLPAPSRAIWAEVKPLWQRYQRGEKVMLTGFAFVGLNQIEREAISELLSASLRRISEILGKSRLPELGVTDPQKVAEAVRLRRFFSGQVVYAPARDPSESSLYVVEKGRISLQLASLESRSLLIASIEEGGVFGGIHVGPAEPLREVAIAEADVYLLEIDRHGSEYLLCQRPELALQLASAAFRAASIRLCRALLEAAARNPELVEQAARVDV